MSQMITTVFDGTVLRPDSKVNLRANSRYIITIAELPTEPSTMGDAWEMLEALTGSVDAPEDWATEHDHYFYGTSKQGFANR
jgi:hypothetical protein